MRNTSMISLVFLMACSGKGGDTGGSGIADPSYASDIQPIWDDNCISCHSTVSADFGSLDLKNDSYDNIVGVVSAETSMDYVTAGDPDNSYLFKKLDGTSGDVSGGDPGQMPDDLPALSQADQDTIKNWIANGALNN